MRLRSPFVVVLCSLTASLIVSAVACSSAGPRPEAGNTDREGGASSSSSSSSGSPRTDSGGDGSSDDGGEAGLPDACGNTVKDGAETDTDCGGNVCGKCIDGKSCIAPTDCAGGACLNGVCVTAKCTDLATNGDESDVDCGGATCAKCTIGKRCEAGTDCVSGSCAGEICRCPKGMTEVSRATGGAYCVDAVEVTKAQYYKFWTAGWPISDQIAECSANTLFTPGGAWPPAETPPGGMTGLQFNISLPVHYVDWCDAHTYCNWAGKQLCGRINGGPISVGAVNDANEDAWYNACSAQGGNDYPYGDTFSAPDSDGGVTKCNVTGIGPTGFVQGGGFGYAANEDDGVYRVIEATDDFGNYSLYLNAGCHGGAVGLYQMSGNVAEWEDSCEGSGPGASCRLRGGSYASYKTAGDETKVRCDAVRTESRIPVDDSVLKDVGFRCCLY